MKQQLLQVVREAPFRVRGRRRQDARPGRRPGCHRADPRPRSDGQGPPHRGAPRIREQLVAMQRAFAARHGKIVTEGRDQGTVVFPDARVKIFLTADPAERARRRAAELQAKGADVDWSSSARPSSPGTRATRTGPSGRSSRRRTPCMIDTTGPSIEESVERITAAFEEQAWLRLVTGDRDPPRQRPPSRQRQGQAP